MQEKISLSEISVIVQGVIHQKRTKIALKSIRKYLPNAEIILSTWENSDVSNLVGLYDVLIFNKEPQAFLQKKFKTKKVYNNLNCMIISTNNALGKVSRKYVLKLRSDNCIDNLNFLDFFNKYSFRNRKYQLFEHRILASTLFSKFAQRQRNKSEEIPFHVSDWWFFGLTSDVKKYLLASETVEEPYFSNYFEFPENQNKKCVFEKFDWKFAPEQHLAYSCFSKYFDDIYMKDCSNISDEINKKSQICLANNFIFLEYKQSGIWNQKYFYSKNERLIGSQYLDLYSHYIFQKEYKKYCENDFILPNKEFIFENNKIGRNVLKFYKHLGKLFDTEVSLLEKFEQIFIGIPFSAISLVLVLFLGYKK